ncbi:hypothetical protein [Kineococcus sp. NPDC059986]|uniref:hypothetical protein n=1 Tax=Kineococcus sp. NPDC059986 TaxID=3155538 RepID=UPI00344DA285
MHADDDPEVEWQRDAMAVSALRAWLLAEEAHPRGGVPDEVLLHLQHHVEELLGPHALFAAGEHVQARVEAGEDLTVLARDRDALDDLLTFVTGKRRPGFELQWQADPGPGGRPRSLLVMAEHCVGDPLWERPVGNGEPVPMTGLGVPEDLVRDLRRWNEEFEHLSSSDSTWPSPDAEAEWAERGLRLAQALQRELPDVDVRYFHADDDRPLRSL